MPDEPIATDLTEKASDERFFLILIVGLIGPEMAALLGLLVWMN